MVTTAAASSATQNPPQENAIAQLSQDYTMFLRLLTTQLQNQDPLDPLDTSQYTQQLVQFAQVEQSVQQTGALKDILARLSTQDMVQAAGLIGREASYNGDVAGLTSGNVAGWSWTLNQAPSTLTAKISDANGVVVDTRALAVDARAFDWDGLLSGGGQAAPGSYSLSLDARDASGNPIAATIQANGTVETVTQDENGLVLTINGLAVSVQDITSFGA